MKKLKNRLNIVVLIISIICCIFLLLKNISSSTFFSVDFMGILTLLIGTYLTYLCSHRLINKNRKSDYIVQLLISINESLKTLNFQTIDEKDQMILKQKTIANKLKFIEDEGYDEIKNDIKYISEQFDDIQSLYSNHNNSAGDLISINKDIVKHIENIDRKCSKVCLMLYNL